jgi:ferredoxin
MLSRKEFFREGARALGQALLNPGRLVTPAPQSEVESDGPLLIDNGRCLAQRGGCFTCIDHCPQHAISIRLGVGIAVDPEKCDGCARCIEICPLEPKIIAVKPLEADSAINQGKEIVV